MDTSDTVIPPERLFEAVDAIYEAAEELCLTELPDRPEDLMGALLQPEAFCDFTRPEIEAASEFLRRMGMLPSKHDAKP